MSDYEARFQQKVDQALKDVRTILDVTRNPSYPPEVQHQYEDKYYLAQMLVNTSVAAHWNWLELLGLTEESLGKMLKWVETRSVTLRLVTSERCAFDKMVERKEDSKDERVTTTKVLGITATTSSKVVTTIKEWFWNFSSSFELYAFHGTDSNDKIVILSNQSKAYLKTTSEHTPYPETANSNHFDLNLTWLLQQIDPETRQARFLIDRHSNLCRTPRRNPQIEFAFSFGDNVSRWAQHISNYLFTLCNKQQPVASTSAIDENQVFVPVLPLFEERSEGSSSGSEPSTSSSGPASSSSSSSAGALASLSPSANEGSKVMLSVSDVNAFLAHQRQTLLAKFTEFDKVYTDGTALLNPRTARVRLVLAHINSICSHVLQGVSLIETMLMNQLIAAIGKVVTAVEFADYMRFHNRKLFQSAYEPRPFCFAVRRPEHYPEGTVAIEGQLGDGSIAQPVLTSVRMVEPVHPMNFALNASTKVTFLGERYLHSWINSSFAGSSGLSLSLVARARQFSSFIILVGRVASATVFQPTGAMIIQNKDELTIPLMLEQIPTPKEFRDAIESLSPEQQRFCKAYRAMQLESTMFGICIIQIKPQLEKLLRLPSDSLTKEIRLTQDLMELFLTYQIPSDLLSYDGPEDASVESKLETVKLYVSRIQEMIQDKKKAELEEAAQKAAAAILTTTPSSPRAPSTSSLNAATSVGGGGPQLQRVFHSAGRGGARPQMSGPGPRMSGPPMRSALPSVSAPTPSPAPSSSSSPVTKPPKSTSEPKTPKTGATEDEQESEEQNIFDFTQLPHKLDRQFAELDLDNALRPTIIKPGKNWHKKFQASLLSKQSSKSLANSERKDEKNRAFDLLDALSRSGALAVDDASFHVVLAATHCFARSVVDTVVQDNVNPIEKVERSLLIMATTIFEKPVAELVKPDQLPRIQEFSPNLFH